MRTNGWHVRLAFAARLLAMGVGAVFLFAFIGKSANPYEFLRSVYGYEIVRAPLAKYFASAMLGVELFVGVGLLFGLCFEASRRLAQIVLSVFVVAQLSVVVRGINADCGCGFGSDDAIGLGSVARTAGLLTAVTGADMLRASRVLTGRSDQL